MGKLSDGAENLDFVYDDGGRRETGRRGYAGDCVCRAISIASRTPYELVYQHLAEGMATQRKTKRTKATHIARSARNGILVRRTWFRKYMVELGFEWVPTMQIGSGCTTHLLKGELPMGRLIVQVTKHYTAVIDGVIRDTHDPSRAVISGVGDEDKTVSHRCVYGYWLYRE